MVREIGKDVLTVDRISKTIDGVKVLNDISFTVAKGDKIAFIGENEIAQTAMMQILAEEIQPDEGSIKWGVSTSVPTSRRITRNTLMAVSSTSFSGCPSIPRISPKPICADSWEECSSLAMMCTSQYRFFPVVRRFAACFRE